MDDPRKNGNVDGGTDGLTGWRFLSHRILCSAALQLALRNCPGNRPLRSEMTLPLNKF
jgi:hypothetical protein